MARNVIRDHASFPGKFHRLKGALMSGKKAAYLGIALNLLRPLTQPLDRFFGGRGRTGPEPSAQHLPPSLMIASPPRSGSTLIYQVLTRTIPSVYYSNMHYLFPKSASRVMNLFGMFGTGLSGFRNYYGYSPKLRDVNEGNPLLAKILPGEDPEEIREHFLRIVSWMRAGPDRPFLFKNVRHYDTIGRLHEAMPELHFLRIKRETAHVVRSELNGYRELGTFHPVPPELRNSGITDPVEFCVRQILLIEASLDKQFEALPEEGKMVWEYEAFCSDAEAHIRALARKLGISEYRLRWKELDTPLRPSTYREEELGEIREALSRVREEMYPENRGVTQ